MSALTRLLALHEERPTFVAVALAVLAFLLAYPFVDWQLRTAGIATEFRFYDFGAYSGAVESWRAGEPIYERNEDGGFHGSYLYPPVFLVVFLPFVDLPFREGAMAWGAVSVLGLWIGLQLAVAACGLDLRTWERVVGLWALLGFQPLLLSVKLGQVSAFLTAMLSFALAAALYGERRARCARASRLASGVATAVAGTVKLAYAPVGAHLLGDRDRLAGAVATGLALVAVSVLLFGVEPHRQYLDVLAWGKGWGDVPRSPSLWLPPYYRPLYALGDLALAVRLVATAGVVALALLAAPVDAHRETFALGVAWMPLLAPHADAYYFVALLPAVVALLAVEFDRPDGGRPLVPVVGLWLVSVHSYGLKLAVDTLPGLLRVLPAADSLGPAVGFLQPGLWGNLLLAGLAAARIAQAAGLSPRLSTTRLDART